MDTEFIIIIVVALYTSLYSWMILAWFFPAYKFLIPFYWRTGKSKKQFATNLQKRSYHKSPLQYKYDQKRDTLYFYKRPIGYLEGPVLSIFGRIVKNEDGTVTFYGGLNPFFVLMFAMFGTMFQDMVGLAILGLFVIVGLLIWHWVAYKDLADKYVRSEK